MDPRIIRTEDQHDAALAEIERLMTLAAPTENEREKLELLALLSEAYEEEHHPVGLPDPIDSIRSRMLDLGLDSADLADIMGGTERTADVLNRSSALTLPMVRGLAARLDLPVEVLVQHYDVTDGAA